MITFRYFEVEQVGPPIQKATKAKSDDCILFNGSHSEGSADDVQRPEFLTTEGATLEVETLAVERSKRLENSEFFGVDKQSGVSVPQNDEKSNTISSGYEGMIAEKQSSEKCSQSGHVQCTAVFTLQQHKPDMLPGGDYFDDATFVVKFGDNTPLKVGIEKCFSHVQSMEQSQQQVGNDGSNVIIESEMAFSSCSVMGDDAADMSVVKGVVRDLINYIVYEVSSIVLEKKMFLWEYHSLFESSKF